MPIRITNSMMVNRAIYNQAKNLQNMSKYNEDLNSMKRIHKPSDDPIMTSRSLKLSSDIIENEQFKRNADAARTWLERTESSLAEITNVLQRSRELANQGANGILGADDKQKIGSEIDQLTKHLVNIGNDTYMGRYIFSGFKTDKEFMNAEGKITADMDVTKLNDERIEYKLGISQNLPVNFTGLEVFGKEKAKTDADGNPVITGKPDMINMMEDLKKKLDLGDSKGVSNILSEIDSHMNNIASLKGNIGAKINMMDTMEDRMDEMGINFKSLLSKAEDTDAAEAYMKLNAYESVYKASLAISAKIIQPTLIDFIR